MGKNAHQVGLEAMNPLSDFKGWGAAGTILTVGGNASKYFGDGVQETDIAASYAGAAAGSFFLPPLGTVVGAIVGFGVSTVLNQWEYGNPPKSTINHIKDGFKAVTHGIGNVMHNT